MTQNCEAGLIHYITDGELRPQDGARQLGKPRPVGLPVALWLAYCALWYLLFRQKLYGKKFAKACIAMFVVAILSLGVVRSAGDRPASSPPTNSGQDGY